MTTMPDRWQGPPQPEHRTRHPITPTKQVKPGSRRSRRGGATSGARTAHPRRPARPLPSHRPIGTVGNETRPSPRRVLQTLPSPHCHVRQPGLAAATVHLLAVQAVVDRPERPEHVPIAGLHGSVHPGGTSASVMLRESAICRAASHRWTEYASSSNTIRLPSA